MDIEATSIVRSIEASSGLRRHNPDIDWTLGSVTLNSQLLPIDLLLVS